MTLTALIMLHKLNDVGIDFEDNSVHHKFGGTEDNKGNRGTCQPVNRLNF